MDIFFGHTGNGNNPAPHSVILKVAAVVAIVVVAWVLIAPSVDLVDSTCDQAPAIVPLPVADHAPVVTAAGWSRSIAELLRHNVWIHSGPEILDVTCTRVC